MNDGFTICLQPIRTQKCLACLALVSHAVLYFDWLDIAGILMTWSTVSEIRGALISPTSQVRSDQIEPCARHTLLERSQPLPRARIDNTPAKPWSSRTEARCLQH
jgi:hypothetical protein